ncbi:MAG: ABC transporter ATP-binding protein [Alcaligenaceae bacterium]|nr:ABC transporter ATP-binding protein [Alcaligenaceae bacterium]
MLNKEIGVQEMRQKEGLKGRGIEIVDLNKAYGAHKVLDQVNLSLPAGRIYGLLGRNGVGKSTLMNILTQKLLANSGDVLVDGVSIKDHSFDLSKLFMISDDAIFMQGFKVKKVFKAIKQFNPAFDEKRAEYWVQKFGLHLKMKTGKMSTGQASLLKNAIVLSMDVPYLLLDEPVLGLDANHREMLYKAILARYMENPAVTMILSSHLIEEISDLVQEVIIIDQAKVLLQSSVDDLKNSGYSVSGRKADIDAYVSNVSSSTVLDRDELGGLSVVYMTGSVDMSYVDQLPFKERLAFDQMSLQKLFVKLTSSQGEGEVE